MYELKTLLPIFDIELPTCMYALRNNSLPRDTATTPNNSICNGNGPGADVSEFNCKVRHSGELLPPPPIKDCVLLDAVDRKIREILKNSTSTSAIERRQENVLQQLNELKSQLASIRAQLGLCQKGIHQSETRNKTMLKDTVISEEPLHDIVINAHPNFIPYALLAIKNLWSGIFNIQVKVFSHSTVPNIGDEAIQFQEKLCAGEDAPNKPGIKVTLIWTNCEHTEMIMSPTMYVPIYGEVNIIRYLGRVGPAEYRYELAPNCNEIDLILDICYQFMRCDTPKAKADVLRVLNNRLQKEKFFGGEQLSLADIGVYSALQRMKCTEKDLTPALKQWHGRARTILIV